MSLTNYFKSYQYNSSKKGLYTHAFFLLQIRWNASGSAGQRVFVWWGCDVTREREWGPAVEALWGQSEDDGGQSHTDTMCCPHVPGSCKLGVQTSQQHWAGGHPTTGQNYSDYEEQKYRAESWAKVEWWRKSTANSNSCWILEDENIMFSIQNLRLHQYPEPLPLTDHHYVSPGSQQVSRHLPPVHSVRAQC